MRILSEFRMIPHVRGTTSSELSEQLLSVFENTKQEISTLANQAPENIIESVHLIRKRLKFLRAFVKLTKYCSDGDTYKDVNYVFRDCGRLISDCRDAHVRTIVLEDLKETESDNSHLPVIDKFLEINSRQTTEIENQLLSGKSVFDELMADLSHPAIKKYFATLKPDSRSLLSGYALCYKKSYNAFHSELTSHQADLLHEWRKRTKDLQYQQEVLVESIPEDLPPSPEEVSELCDLLGRINDLFMVSEWIHQLDSTIIGGEDVDAFIEIIQKERESVQKQADKLGHSLYKFNPEEYSEKLLQILK